MGVLVNNEHDDAENGLCADTQSNLGGRVLGEEEKAQLYRFARPRGTVGSCPQNLCVSTLGDLVRSFIGMVYQQGC